MEHTYPTPTPERLAERIHNLDDRKMSYAWEGTKGFLKEIFTTKGGLATVGLAAVAGGMVGGLAFGLDGIISQFTNAAPNLTAGSIGTIAAATAGSAAVVVGAKGAMEHIQVAKITNEDLDRTIADAQTVAIQRGVDEVAVIQAHNAGTSKDPLVKQHFRNLHKTKENILTLNDASPTVDTKDSSLIGRIGLTLEQASENTLNLR